MNRPLINFSVGIIFVLCTALLTYKQFEIDVPEKHIAVLTHRVGLDLENNQETAPDAKYKGIQLNVLNEGRYYYNPYSWDWAVYPMVEIPEGFLGVRIRLYGDDLGYGHFLADTEAKKGVVAEVLRPGRYPLNALVLDENKKPIHERKKQDYVEVVELHRPITIDAGFKGVVTNLAGPMPENPNHLLVPKGFRGVQKDTLEAGTHYVNPYMTRVEKIDCRSQRFNLSSSEEMGFPSKDGFWVSLDGVIEFRISPDHAAETYVLYNELEPNGTKSEDFSTQIIKKIIMPNARSFCRLRGSNASGREFIGGETRTDFQEAFQKAISHTCSQQGIDIIQALITKINPPKPIAEPIKEREVYAQRLKQYGQEITQYEEKANLATEEKLISQRKALVDADRQVVENVAQANKEQAVKMEQAERDLAVAKEDLQATKDQASAVLAKSQTEASIIEYENKAKAAGWKKSVNAFNGDGEQYARYVLYQKLAPSYRSIMTNSADSPLMEVFRSFGKQQPQSQNMDPHYKGN